MPNKSSTYALAMDTSFQSRPMINAFDGEGKPEPLLNVFFSSMNRSEISPVSACFVLDRLQVKTR